MKFRYHCPTCGKEIFSNKVFLISIKVKLHKCKDFVWFKSINGWMDLDEDSRQFIKRYFVAYYCKSYTLFKGCRDVILCSCKICNKSLMLKKSKTKFSYSQCHDHMREHVQFNGSTNNG